ncbi:MAG: hypothetical protein ABI051_12400 [Vicinamibacterales bacterium]
MNWKLVAAVSAGLATYLAVKAARQRRDRFSMAENLDSQVHTASDDSFPASDPPSYTPTAGSKLAY